MFELSNGRELRTEQFLEREKVDLPSYTAIIGHGYLLQSAARGRDTVHYSLTLI